MRCVSVAPKTDWRWVKPCFSFRRVMEWSPKQPLAIFPSCANQADICSRNTAWSLDRLRARSKMVRGFDTPRTPTRWDSVSRTVHVSLGTSCAFPRTRVRCSYNSRQSNTQRCRLAGMATTRSGPRAGICTGSCVRSTPAPTTLTHCWKISGRSPIWARYEAKPPHPFKVLALVSPATLPGP